MIMWLIYKERAHHTARGVYEKDVKSFDLTASGFDSLFRMRTRTLWQQTLPEPVIIP